MPAVDEEPTLQRLFGRTAKQLSEAGVRWTLLRMPSRPAAPIGDVDLLVDRRDVRLLRNELALLGFRRLPYLGHSRSYLSYDPEGDEWLWLDIATDIIAAGRPLPRHITSSVLERSRQLGRLRLPDPADSLWLLLIHLISVRRPLRSHHRTSMAAYGRELGALPDLEDAAVRLFGRGWTVERVRAAIAAGDWDTLERALRSGPEHGSPWRDPTSVAVALAGGLAQRIPIRARRGLSVALLGPDGAGKSTLAGGIRDAFFFPVHLIYMGTGLAPTTSGVGRARLLRWFSGTALDPLGALLTQWWRYALGVIHRGRGRLVVFDRYTEDALLPPVADLSRTRQITRILRRGVACPAPDLAVILDAPGSTMYARKGEHDPHALEAMRMRYLALRSRYPRAMVLDTTQAPEIVRRQLTRKLWNLYSRRLPSPIE